MPNPSLAVFYTLGLFLCSPHSHKWSDMLHNRVLCRDLQWAHLHCGQSLVVTCVLLTSNHVSETAIGIDRHIRAEWPYNISAPWTAQDILKGNSCHLYSPPENKCHPNTLLWFQRVEVTDFSHQVVRMPPYQLWSSQRGCLDTQSPWVLFWLKGNLEVFFFKSICNLEILSALWYTDLSSGRLSIII